MTHVLCGSSLNYFYDQDKLPITKGFHKAPRTDCRDKHPDATKSKRVFEDSPVTHIYSILMT